MKNQEVLQAASEVILVIFFVTGIMIIFDELVKIQNFLKDG